MGYNTKIKYFPNSNSIQIKTYSWTIEEGSNFAVNGSKHKVYDNIQEAQKNAIKSQNTSLRRTKNMIYDIAKSNENFFTHFCTLTFDPKKVDSFNYDEVSKKVTNYLNRMRKRNDNLKYIGVMEKHKSGRYHFHFLMGGCENMDFLESGHKTSNGDIIYNIGSYRLGWSTATQIRDKSRSCSYLTKYITKCLFEHTKNKKRYWSSKNLVRPYEEKLNLDLDSYTDVFESDADYHKHIDIPTINQSMEIYEFKKELLQQTTELLHEN